jgi:hypothetical protein
MNNHRPTPYPRLLGSYALLLVMLGRVVAMGRDFPLSGECLPTF